MYRSDARLPHLLPPHAYAGEAALERDRRTALAGAWSLAGALDDLGKPGDFVTCRAGGRPVMVRNFDGELRALSNVCAHRHCLLTSKTLGRAATLKCQYHGWEYGADGVADHIPQSDDFRPFDAPRPALPAYRLALCGQLVFVAVDAAAPTLEDFLGDLYSVVAERFGADWRRTLRLDQDIAANWKIPVENALEAYHVPMVHPETFKTDPGEARSQHVLEPGRTELIAQLPFAAQSPFHLAFQGFEKRLLRWLGEAPTATYRHVHVFPDLLFSFTDTVSLIQTVQPRGPARSTGLALQFGLARRGWPGWKRALMRPWTTLGAGVTRRILEEDMALFPAIQEGLASSPQTGVLGRAEERVHAFQRWLLDQAGVSGRESR